MQQQPPQLHSLVFVKLYRPGVDSVETYLHPSGAVLRLLITEVLRLVHLLLQLPCSQNTVPGQAAASSHSARSSSSVITQCQVKQQRHHTVPGQAAASSHSARSSSSFITQCQVKQQRHHTVPGQAAASSHSDRSKNSFITLTVTGQRTASSHLQ